MYILFSCIVDMQAQQRHSNKHKLYPGLSIAYLPTWILDDYDGNKSGTTFMAGLYGHQEIWKESVFSMGISHAKIDVKNGNEHTGIIVPIKLQKFFNPDRRGFNLSFGVLFNYCRTCGGRIGGAVSNEISYLVASQPVQVNVGLQIIEGFLFDDSAIHMGGQVQLIWHPQGDIQRH